MLIRELLSWLLLLLCSFLSNTPPELQIQASMLLSVLMRHHKFSFTHIVNCHLGSVVIITPPYALVHSNLVATNSTPLFPTYITHGVGVPSNPYLVTASTS